MDVEISSEKYSEPNNVSRKDSSLQMFQIFISGAETWKEGHFKTYNYSPNKPSAGNPGLMKHSMQYWHCYDMVSLWLQDCIQMTLPKFAPHHHYFTGIMKTQGNIIFPSIQTEEYVQFLFKRVLFALVLNNFSKNLYGPATKW